MPLSHKYSTINLMLHELYYKSEVKVKSLSRVLATPWTVAYQAPPSMGFSRQEYWSGLPFPSPVLTFKNIQKSRRNTKLCLPMNQMALYGLI